MPVKAELTVLGFSHIAVFLGSASSYFSVYFNKEKKH